ncbi:MAG: FAD-binding oxidoreductase [Pseudomonadota bacterium]
MPPRRKFWGWGHEGEGVDAAEAEFVRAAVAARLGALPPPLPVPRREEFQLRAPRFVPPAALAAIFSADPADRLAHAQGQSFADIARAFLRAMAPAPDLVAFPRTAEEVRHLLDWADGGNIAVIPFGGGTSVCGGVEADVGEGYAATLSIDMRAMNRVLDIDRTNRAALIEAGATGPEFEAALKPHGLTLRHFPQSYALATLGGMIVTRSAGHFATQFTHIDSFVEAVTMLSPAGALATRRLPASGAGPDAAALIAGSEGTLGIVTSAWMRLQDAPIHRATRSLRFADFFAGAQALRAIVQAGLAPANGRLIDPQEAAASGAGTGREALLVLGFESADHPQDARLQRAVEIAGDHGGIADPPRAKGGAAEAWRMAFLRMPFWREVLVPCGVIVDTFETACLWSDFAAFHRAVSDDLKAAMRAATGRDGVITCRITHVYPDGPAPYFSFYCLGEQSRMLDQWRAIKLAANQAVVRHGGTATHHHAVGRDHRPRAYDEERPALLAAALAGAKAALDPRAVMNPGVLIDPMGRPAGGRGVLADAAALTP